jgi:hypothetical protein
MELAQRIGHEWKREPAGDLEGMVSLAMFKRRVPVTHLVLSPGRPPALARNVEATPDTFRFLYEAADGARIYRVRRGGSGPLIRRLFREEQLRGATLEVRFRARGGVPAVVRLNGTDLGPTTAGSPLLRVLVPEGLVKHDAIRSRSPPWTASARELEDVVALTSGPTACVGKRRSRARDARLTWPRKAIPARALHIRVGLRGGPTERSSMSACNRPGSHCDDSALSRLRRPGASVGAAPLRLAPITATRFII